MKVIFTIILTSIVVLFALQNFEYTSLYFFGSKPVRIRLFFVIIFSGVIGWMLRYIIGISREEEFKKRFKMLLAEYKRIKAMVPDEDYEEF